MNMRNEPGTPSPRAQKVGIIVGGAPILREAELLKRIIKDDSSFVIAADAGISYLVENSLRVNEFVGDMDSVDEDIDQIKIIYPGIKISQCSPIKDVTDTEIALEKLVKLGCKEVHIFGGVGGSRIEHTFANIQLISRYKNLGIKCYLYGDNIMMHVLSDGDVEEYDSRYSGLISVFSLSDISRNVTIKGLFYEFSGDLTNDNALGVSNRFTGKEASISIENGRLLVTEELLFSV